ncbi:hypothetical protein MRX96_024083 [Rhipicephalus microplus]
MCRCKQPAPGTVHNVSDEASGGTELLLHGVYLVGTEQPHEVEVQIASQLVKMQVDTGAAISLVPECVYRQLKQPPQLAKCEMKLKTYGGATLQVKGQAEVLVDYKGERKVLPIIVVPGEKPALLGRDWIANLGMDLNSIHEVPAQPSVDSILSRSVWIPEQTRMAQPGSTPSQSDSDTASPPDGPAPEQRLPPPDRASVTELPSQQAPDASSQENVAPPELRRSTRIRKPPERFGYAAK